MLRNWSQIVHTTAAALRAGLLAFPFLIANLVSLAALHGDEAASVTASTRKSALRMVSLSRPLTSDPIETASGMSSRSEQTPEAARTTPMPPAVTDALVVDPLQGALASAPTSRQAADCFTLDGRDIACRSAQNWLPADILRQRARTLVHLFEDEKPDQRQAAASLARFLCIQADHQEDIGAASGLRSYYTRVALSEQLLLSQESLELIDSELRKQQIAQQQGLPTGVDLASFERRQFEVQDKQLQILSQDRQLRCVLAQIAKLDYAMSEACQEQLVVVDTPLDCSALQQLALMQRSDLKAWIYLCSCVNEDTAPVYAQMLGTLIGNWGLPLPKAVGLKALLCPPDYGTLAANLRYEISLIVETHRQWICQAVQEKCEAVRLAYARIALAQKTVASWETRVQRLVDLAAQGSSAPRELAEARVELLKVRSDEISRRLDAKLAEIDLAEATGGIRDRCCLGLAWLQTGL